MYKQRSLKGGGSTLGVANRTTAGWLLTGAFLVVLPAGIRGDTVVVTDSGDALHDCSATGVGTCTLRDAINFGNQRVGSDTITFSIGTGSQVIRPLSPLPDVTDALEIQGGSQPGAGSVRIEIEGSLAGASADGLRILYGLSKVTALSIDGFSGNGIVLSGGGDNQVAGCYIGADASRAVTHGNGGSGLLISSSAHNLIGSPLTGNYIAGNATGIRIDGVASDGNAVQGNAVGGDQSDPSHSVGNLGDGIQVFSGQVNFVVGNLIASNGGNGIRIGVDGGLVRVQGNSIGGLAALLNGGHGILIETSAANLIGGGAGYSDGNQIGSNSGDGIRITGGSNGNVIQGNYIGTDGFNSTDLGNGGAGIAILDSIATMIGGAAIARNVLANNHGPAVSIEGTSQQNTVTRNWIFSNGGLGIDLGSDGPTANDDCDVDTGPNGLQNSPIVLQASSEGGNVILHGTLDASPNAPYRLEFYSSTSCDSSGDGQDELFLGAADVTTGESCGAVFDVAIPIIRSGLRGVTATATDSVGNTSEFSACVPMATQFFSIAPCRIADTRGPLGPHGGPSLSAGEERTLFIPTACGIPSTAQAIVFNFTVVAPTAAGNLQIFPPGSSAATASTLNYRVGQTRANNATLPLGQFGEIVVRTNQPTGKVDLVIDASGYFQ